MNFVAWMFCFDVVMVSVSIPVNMNVLFVLIINIFSFFVEDLRLIRCQLVQLLLKKYLVLVLQ